MATTPNTSSSHSTPPPRRLRPQQIIARNETPFASRPPTRLYPMLALVLGLCRTGTSSLREALHLLEFPEVYHMDSLAHVGPGEADAWLAAFARYEQERRTHPKPHLETTEQELAFWDRMTGHVAAVTDIPCSVFHAQLLRCYPDAPVILTIRTPGTDEEAALPRHLHGARAFATSTHDTILEMRRKLWWMAPGWLSDVFVRVGPIPRAMLVRRTTLSVLFGDDVCVGAAEREIAIAEEAYRRHNGEVVEMCERMGREVFLYDVKDGWGPLVGFLNERREEGSALLVVPKDGEGQEVPFPRLNDTAAFHRTLAMRAKQTQEVARKAMQRRLRSAGMVVVGALVAAAIAVWVQGGRT